VVTDDTLYYINVAYWIAYSTVFSAVKCENSTVLLRSMQLIAELSANAARAVFMGGGAGLTGSTPLEMLGIFKVNVTILRKTVKKFCARFARTLFLPPLLNLFCRLVCLYLLHALNLTC